MVPSAKTPLVLRWWGLLWGIVTLFWLSIEDENILFISIISVVWCAWVGFWAYWQGSLNSWVNRLLWMGVFSGLNFFPVAFTFVLVKAGVHAHGLLDFTTLQLTRLTIQTFFWAAFGGIIGMAIQHFSLD